MIWKMISYHFAGDRVHVEMPEEVPKVTVVETNGKLETLRRHVPQMILRGEQVAIIVKINWAGHMQASLSLDRLYSITLLCLHFRTSRLRVISELSMRPPRTNKLTSLFIPTNFDLTNFVIINFFFFYNNCSFLISYILQFL